MSVLATVESKVTSLLDTRLREALGDGWTVAAASGRWMCRVTGTSDANDSGLAFTTWIEDGWLRFDAAPARPADPRAHATALLVRSGHCATAAKLAVDPAGRVRARAELPIGSVRDLDLASSMLSVERMRETASGILCLGRDEVHTDHTAAAQTEVHGVADQADAALCTEAGWEHVVHADGSLAVELPVAGAFCQAFVARPAIEKPGRPDPSLHHHAHTHGTDTCAPLRIATVLDVAADASETGRAAVEALMLRTSGWVRLIRASVVDAGANHAGSRPALEAWLGTAPTAGELAEALSAMTAAARWCVRSAEALAANEAIASAFLAALSRAADGPAGCEAAHVHAPPCQP